MKTLLVPLAPGFEEIEAVTVIDVLRRAGAHVIVAGLESTLVTGSHAITLSADCLLSELEVTVFDAIVLPGGMPGAEHLRDHEGLQSLLAQQHQRGAWIAAICAAPMALEPMRIAASMHATSYPGFEKNFSCTQYSKDRVVIDQHLITSRGPGTALEFALAIVEQVIDAGTASRLRTVMLVE